MRSDSEGYTIHPTSMAPEEVDGLIRTLDTAPVPPRRAGGFMPHSYPGKRAHRAAVKRGRKQGAKARAGKG